MKLVSSYLIALVFAAVCGVYVLVPYFAQPSNARRIALFIPATHPAMAEIEQGFKETILALDPEHAYQYTEFNANGNKTLMRAQAEEIAQANFDLIFSIGTGCSKSIKEVTSKKGYATPLVFTAVDNPVNAQIIATLESSGNNVTGVTEVPDYDQEIAALINNKPNTKQVMLVYDPHHGAGLEKDRAAIATILAARGIGFSSVEIFQSNEIQQKVTGSLDGVDVIMILPDHTIVSAIDSLIKLCNQRGITLLASDLNSGEKGAALAYGIREYDFGSQAARKAHLILNEHRSPSSIPTTIISGHRMIINQKTAPLQNIQSAGN